MTLGDNYCLFEAIFLSREVGWDTWKNLLGAYVVHTHVTMFTKYKIVVGYPRREFDATRWDATGSSPPFLKTTWSSLGYDKGTLTIPMHLQELAPNIFK